MKTKLSIVLTLLTALVLLGQTESQKDSKLSRLGKTAMHEATTEEGFEFFSGYLDTSRIPMNFPTMYLYKKIGSAAKIKIVGNRINMEFPATNIEEALFTYKGLVKAKLSTDEKELTDFLKGQKSNPNK